MEEEILTRLETAMRSLQLIHDLIVENFSREGSSTFMIDATEELMGIAEQIEAEYESILEFESSHTVRGITLEATVTLHVKREDDAQLNK